VHPALSKYGISGLALIAAIGTAAVTKYRVEALEEWKREHSLDFKVLEGRVNDQGLDVREMKTNVQFIREAIVEIKKAVVPPPVQSATYRSGVSR
jgi:hypothetical protein